jgi:hypothetical protein
VAFLKDNNGKRKQTFMKKSKVNAEGFKNIDTLAHAYILGLL